MTSGARNQILLCIPFEAPERRSERALLLRPSIHFRPVFFQARRFPTGSLLAAMREACSVNIRCRIPDARRLTVQTVPGANRTPGISPGTAGRVNCRNAGFRSKRWRSLSMTASIFAAYRSLIFGSAWSSGRRHCWFIVCRLSLLYLRLYSVFAVRATEKTARIVSSRDQQVLLAVAMIRPRPDPGVRVLT